jgi:hypothetical protein
MRNAYQRAMLFLTYIQGPIINEWVKGVNAWLRGQIIHQRWAPTDERLWIEVFDSFNRQFANVMEQEDAQAALAKGLQLDKCHGSAGTPLRTHAGTEALGLQDARTAIRT